MKYLNGKFYVEVKDHRYTIHNGQILRLRPPPKSLKTMYQVMYDVKLPKKSKVIRDDNGNLVVVKLVKDDVGDLVVVRQPNEEQHQPNEEQQPQKANQYCPVCRSSLLEEFDE